MGHVVADLDGRFLDFDRRYCGILGYGRDEMLAMTLQGVTHPDDLPRNLALLRRLLTGHEPFSIRKRYVRRDGSTVWVENHVSMLTAAANGGAARLCAASTLTWAAPHAVAGRAAAGPASRNQALRDRSHSLNERSRQLRSRTQRVWERDPEPK